MLSPGDRVLATLPLRCTGTGRSIGFSSGSTASSFSGIDPSGVADEISTSRGADGSAF